MDNLICATLKIVQKTMLVGLHSTPKLVVHHSNEENPSRCFVSLYREYVHNCPTERKTGAFYLTPLKRPKEDVWYSNTAVSHNTLDNTVKRLCAAAGIQGFKTNHSLRVTNG